MCFQLRHLKIRWSIIDFLNDNFWSSTSFNAIDTLVLHVRTCWWNAFLKTDGIFAITTILMTFVRTLISFGKWRTDVAISRNTFTNTCSSETIMHFQIKFGCTLFLKFVKFKYESYHMTHRIWVTVINSKKFLKSTLIRHVKHSLCRHTEGSP